MKLLKTIYETDNDPKYEDVAINYDTRNTVRVIIFNNKNEIAILFIDKYKIHTLPGGGIKDDEDISKALRREVLEETGYKIGNIEELGKVISYRNKHKIIQTDYGFVAKADKKIQKPQYSKGEEDSGMVLKWYNLISVIQLLQKDKLFDYEKKYKIVRDLVFLEKVKNILEKE